MTTSISIMTIIVISVLTSVHIIACCLSPISETMCEGFENSWQRLQSIIIYNRMLPSSGCTPYILYHLTCYKIISCRIFLAYWVPTLSVWLSFVKQTRHSTALHLSSRILVSLSILLYSRIYVLASTANKAQQAKHSTQSTEATRSRIGRRCWGRFRFQNLAFVQLPVVYSGCAIIDLGTTVIEFGSYTCVCVWRT